MKKIFLILLVLSCYQVFSQKTYPTEKFAFTNVNLLTMESSEIQSNAVVLVSNGKIEKIGNSNLSIPKGYTILNMENTYLLPGMIDAHTHLSNLAAGERALKSGVTTVRSASTSAYQDVTFSELVKQGKFPGPDMIPTGVFVTPNIGETVLADPRLGNLMKDIQSEEDLRELVGINIDRGVGYIKTRATERAGLPDTDPRKQTYTEEQLHAVVDEAAKSNIRVMVHAHGDEGARAAVKAGAASIEHGSYLSEETLKLMKERGTYFVPTYITLVDLIEPGGDYDNPVLEMRGKYMLPQIEKAIKNAIQMEVKLVTGADNRYTSESTSRVSMEVEHFVRLGMDPYKAIKTTTSNAAELLGIEDNTGLIKEGYEADLIAIPYNPLVEITSLQDVIMVMSNGNLVFNRLPFRKD